LIAEQAEAVSWLVLRLAIQLDLKFPYLTRCCQTHRQSPYLCSFTSTPRSRGPLLCRYHPASSVSGRRWRRLRADHRPPLKRGVRVSRATLSRRRWMENCSAHPTTPSDPQTGRRPVRRRSESGPPRSPGGSPNYPDHLLCMPCSLPRWTGSGARRLIFWRVPAPGSSLSVQPSPLCRPVGIHNSLSRPAQASLTLQPTSFSRTSPGLSRGPSWPVSWLGLSLPSPTDNRLGGSFPH